MSSSGSTMPRLKKCFQYRFTSALAKNGFAGSAIQSTSASRGSRSARDVARRRPQARRRQAFARLGIRRTGQRLACCKRAARQAGRPACAPLARRRPRSRSSRAGSRPRTDDGGSGHIECASQGTIARSLRLAGSSSFTSRYQATGGLSPTSPDAVRMSRTNWSYGLLTYRLSRIQSWNAYVPRM